MDKRSHNIGTDPVPRSIENSQPDLTAHPHLRVEINSGCHLLYTLPKPNILVAAPSGKAECADVETQYRLRHEFLASTGRADRRIIEIRDYMKRRLKTCRTDSYCSGSDTGVGIEQKDLSAVFEKFIQVGDTLTDKPQGTGLGLPICREIIEQHGGTIRAESEPGKGSTFTFEIPRADTNQADTNE